METVQAYLARKYEELELLNSCLRKPLSFLSPRSVEEVIERKFELTALLRAEQELENWKATETAWAHESSTIGPFDFNYDYQRADLKVRGPSFYELGEEFTHETIYSLRYGGDLGAPVRVRSCHRPSSDTHPAGLI